MLKECICSNFLKKILKISKMFEIFIENFCNIFWIFFESVPQRKNPGYAHGWYSYMGAADESRDKGNNVYIARF